MAEIGREPNFRFSKRKFQIGSRGRIWIERMEDKDDLMGDGPLISGEGLAPLERLKRIMHRLRAPGGCPWDAEQSHESLIPNLIEEAYETAEAIRSGDREHLVEELGDLLLQPVFHAELAEEAGLFTLDDVATAISEKLVRRHPHVFGETVVDGTSGVLTQWEEIKDAEKGESKKHFLDAVPLALPGLMRAQKIQKKVAKVGFDWEELAQVFEKIREEVDEVGEVLGDNEKLGEEIGDLLFAVVNLARKSGMDAEEVLAAANEKFIGRFAKVEESLNSEGKSLKEASLEEMEAAWQNAKKD